MTTTIPTAAEARSSSSINRRAIEELNYRRERDTIVSEIASQIDEGKFTLWIEDSKAVNDDFQNLSSRLKDELMSLGYVVKQHAISWSK